jgi:hypothetical protein
MADKVKAVGAASYRFTREDNPMLIWRLVLKLVYLVCLLIALVFKVILFVGRKTFTFAGRLTRNRLTKRSSQPDVLDTVLLNWTPRDSYTVRDLVNGGAAVVGRTGSGKTSSSGRTLAESIVRFPKSGGLILAGKSDDRAFWESLFAKVGRSSDLRVFSPSEPLRFNFMNYAQRLSNEPRNIVNYLQTLGESLRGFDNQPSGDQGKFWKQQDEVMLYSAVVIVKLARGGQVNAPDLQKFIAEAASSQDQITSPQWIAGAHSQWLEAAHKAPKTEIETHDFELAVEYWLGQYPSMATRTRSSIVASVMGILHVFNTGTVRMLASGATNISPDDMFAGKWILVDMCPSVFGIEGSLICSAWKYLTQRAVLKRTVKANDCINVIWADEAQQFVNSHDATYLAQCRSHRGCMVMLSQSLPGYFTAMSGDSGEHQTHSLLANFSHTIVHAVDAVTAEWASKKLGKQREAFISGSLQPATDVFDELFGTPRMTGSYSEQYEPVLQENVFMNGLRTGGRANRYICDAIIIRSGEPFANGANWLWKEFSQELK